MAPPLTVNDLSRGLLVAGRPLREVGVAPAAREGAGPVGQRR